MSKITPTSTPLGLAAPVLDEVTLKQLPSFLPPDARQALQTPSSDPILAAVSVGQLLRTGELRGPSRARLQTWLRDRNEAFGTLIAQQGEQLIDGAIGELAAVASSPQARALTDDQREVTEAEATEAEAPRGWLRGCLLQRDQAESLLVVLGKIALESPVEEVSDLAGIPNASTKFASLDRPVRVAPHGVSVHSFSRVLLSTHVEDLMSSPLHVCPT